LAPGYFLSSESSAIAWPASRPAPSAAAARIPAVCHGSHPSLWLGQLPNPDAGASRAGVAFRREGLGLGEPACPSCTLPIGAGRYVTVTYGELNGDVRGASVARYPRGTGYGRLGRQEERPGRTRFGGH
jgi:hypothetical protein